LEWSSLKNKLINYILLSVLLTNSTRSYSDDLKYDNTCDLVDVETTNADSNQAQVGGIYQLFMDWREAIKVGDAESIANLVTEDAEFWSNGYDPLIGRLALKQAFEPFLAEYNYTQDYSCLELIIRGDVAFIRGHEENTKTPHKGGDTITTRQRTFSVIRQTKSGKWLFSRGMSNLPLQAK